jgi:hypothetical protein
LPQNASAAGLPTAAGHARASRPRQRTPTPECPLEPGENRAPGLDTWFDKCSGRAATIFCSQKQWVRERRSD